MKSVRFHWRSLQTRLTLVTLVIFFLGIWSLTLYVMRALQSDMKEALGEQQFAAVTIAAADVNQELIDRLNSLQYLAREIKPELLGSTVALQTFIEHRPLLHRMFNSGVMVLDIHGKAIAGVPYMPQRIGVGYGDRDYASGAIGRNQPTIGRPVMSKTNHVPAIALAVPIRDAQGQAIGALVGLIDLSRSNFLNNIFGHRHGKTGSYYLVAPQYRLVVSASDPSLVMQSMPAPGTDIMADRYAQGFEGYATALDYRGVEQLSAGHQIAAVGWFVAAVLPSQEAFASITALKRRMLVTASVLSLLVGAVIWLWLRRQLAPLTSTVALLTNFSNRRQLPSTLPVTRNDEVGRLVSGFNELLVILNQREVALNASEERFRTLIEWSPEPMVVHRGGKLLYTNPAALQLFGASDQQALVGKSMLDFVHPDDRASVVERMQRSHEQGSNPPMVEERFLKLDGTVMNVEVTGIVINYDGHCATQVTMHDVTERNENQQRLERLLREQKAILDSDLVGIARLGNRAVQWCNRAFEKMLGYGAGELLGTSMRQHYRSDEAYRALGEAAGPVVAAAGVFGSQVEFVRRDGSPIWVKLNGVKLSSEQNESLWILLDITERRQAEEKLRTLSRIVEQAPMTIAITAIDGTIEYGNPWLSKVTGYTLEEVLGNNPRLFKSGQTAPQVYLKMWETLTSGKVWRGEFCNQKKNGEIYFEQAVIAPVLDDDGQVRHYVALKEDITERKQIEQDLQSSLQEKVVLLNEVHHRVKNNLQVIASLLRLESGRSAQPETKTVLGEMQGRIRSMALLHESLYRTGTFASVELGAYLRQIATQVFRSQTNGAVRLQLDLAPVQISQDQAMPCGLLVNELLANCLKHGFPQDHSGEIRIELQAATTLATPESGADQWRLCVRDTGVGLPADFQAKCDHTLGLQLVSDLTRQLDGTLEIGPGPGTAFTITFTIA